jgi:hypothetical protein
LPQYVSYGFNLYLVDADHALFGGLQTKGKSVSLSSIER